MARSLEDVTVIQFETEVKHAYQTKEATLVGTTTERKGIVASDYSFRRMDKGVAVERTAPSSDAIPMNVQHESIWCGMKNWEANEYTDIFQSKEVNFDEIKELAETIAGALGRRDDQIKLDAMAEGIFQVTPQSGTSGGLVNFDIGGMDTNLNIEKLTAIAQYMDDSEVPETGRHIVFSASGKNSLLNSTQVASADYNSVKALVNGEINTFMGFSFHLIGRRDEEGGLRLDATSTYREGYAWHESAIGYVNGIEMTTSVDWIPHKKSWLSVGNLRAGAVIRDIDGIVKYQTKEG